LCEPLTRLGAEVVGVDPSETNIAVAKLHAERGHLTIDYRCTTIEEMDPRERFDIVLAMEVVEHVADVGLFLDRCAALQKPSGMMVVATLNRTWKSFALAIVGVRIHLRWLPRGTINGQFAPRRGARHSNATGSPSAIRRVVYSPFATSGACRRTGGTTWWLREAARDPVRMTAFA